MKKVLIYGGIAVAVIAILIIVFKPKAKKPCPCQQAKDPNAAIDSMTTADLKEQINVLDKNRALEGLSDAELKAILKELINK